MATVDPIYAQWLQADALWLMHEDADQKVLWGESTATTERMTALSDKADAQAEAVRQFTFLKGPLALDTAELEGSWAGYIGQVITIQHEDLGYDDGLDVFLIGVQDSHAKNISTVTFLRRL